MKELELKHLAPYLPYGLSIKTDSGIREMSHFNNDSEATPFAVKKKQYKPILRPLTDLNIEIEHEGNKFVPLNCVSELDSSGCFIDYSDLSKWEHINEYPFGVINEMIRWHFDVFGLIEKGLAIDINTINPQ